MTQKRTAVVLGASGEIGRAICRNLADSGWSLYLHFNKRKVETQLLTAELRALYQAQEFIPIQADFTKEEGAQLLAKQVQGVEAIVVANGQSLTKLLTETTINEMTELWRVHVQNPAHFIANISSQLRSFEKSYIVFIGSIWGDTGAAGEVMYSAVKGAQHAFVKAYAKESAYSGIRVNAIAPGWIDTEMNALFSDEDRQLVTDEIPLMKVGTTEDVANTVDFLVNGKADYMTGEILKLNGGWYI